MRKNKEETKTYNLWYRQTFPEKVSHSQAAWVLNNKDKVNEYHRWYRQQPKGRFVEQKIQAKRRGIVWELSFDEWWGIWNISGKWAERGYSKGKYCMCRYSDLGPYSKNNVVIALTDDNKSRKI